MREDDDQFRYYVPLLRRIIILVAVLTAVPVILWTITAFVRSYVGPPRIPTFHQLAATESSDALANADSGSAAQPAAEQAKPADPAPATLEARAAAVETREVSVPSKGPSLVDRSPDGGVNMPISPTKMTDASPVASPAPKAPDTLAAPLGPKTTGMPPVPTPPNAPPATTGTLAAQQPAAASEPPPAEALPASPPLSGPIPLPRRRPHVIAEAPMTQVAQINVPMPRPRPDTAGPASQPETGAGPLDFLQNIFH